MKSFAGVLHELITQRHISNQDIADMLFVPVEIVDQWAEGKGVPDKQKLERLASWYGLDFNMLVRSTKVKSLPIVSQNTIKTAPTPSTSKPSNPTPSRSYTPPTNSSYSQPTRPSSTVSATPPPAGKPVSEKAYKQMRTLGVLAVFLFFFCIITIASPISFIGFVLLGVLIWLIVTLVKGMKLPDRPILVSDEAIIFIYSETKYDVIPYKDIVSVTPKLASSDSGYLPYGKIYVSTPEREYVMPFVAECVETVKVLRLEVEKYQKQPHK